MQKIRLSIALASWILASQAGCTRAPVEQLPKTYPVSGKVVNEAGQPVTAGVVEFVPLADAKVQAIGKLRPDGTFSLTTMIGKNSLPGGVEGDHKVALLPMTQGQRPFYFKKRYKVEPGENHFELTYPHDGSGQ